MLRFRLDALAIDPPALRAGLGPAVGLVEKMSQHFIVDGRLDRDPLIAELRRFYRLNREPKLRHIERTAG